MSWDKVCQSKDRGVIGIRKNEIFKLGFENQDGLEIVK